jgi:hypothetical protein
LVSVLKFSLTLWLCLFLLNFESSLCTYPFISHTYTYTCSSLVYGLHLFSLGLWGNLLWVHVNYRYVFRGLVKMSLTLRECSKCVDFVVSCSSSVVCHWPSWKRCNLHRVRISARKLGQWKQNFEVDVVTPHFPLSLWSLGTMGDQVFCTMCPCHDILCFHWPRAVAYPKNDWKLEILSKSKCFLLLC